MILDSSNSSYSVENAGAFVPKPQIAVKRARSKRTRTPCFKWQFTLPFSSPDSSASKKLYYSCTGSESDSDPPVNEKRHKLVKRKRKQKKNNLLHFSTPGVDIRKSSIQGPGEVKKCTHCQVTRTPQWREGPMGPKTLCNACGVRYRSGRLYPEYRPAASPTFIPSLHSNSHKEVIEIRNKAIKGGSMDTLSLPLIGNSVR